MRIASAHRESDFTDLVNTTNSNGHRLLLLPQIRSGWFQLAKIFFAILEPSRVRIDRVCTHINLCRHQVEDYSSILLRENISYLWNAFFICVILTRWQIFVLKLGNVFFEIYPVQFSFKFRQKAMKSEWWISFL